MLVDDLNNNNIFYLFIIPSSIPLYYIKEGNYFTKEQKSALVGTSVCMRTCLCEGERGEWQGEAVSSAIQNAR